MNSPCHWPAGEASAAIGFSYGKSEEKDKLAFHRSCVAPELETRPPTKPTMVEAFGLERIWWPVQSDAGGVHGAASSSIPRAKHPDSPAVFGGDADALPPPTMVKAFGLKTYLVAGTRTRPPLTAYDG